MYEKADIADAIKNHRKAAEEALLVVQSDKPNPITLAAFDALATPARLAEDRLVEELEQRALLDGFVLAMNARGVVVDAAEFTLADDNFPSEVENLISRGKAFRCRVMAGDTYRGSACLIGPSLVLTAWHVIATQWANSGNGLNYPGIEVVLADDKRYAVLPSPVYVSPSTQLEFTGQFPSDEQAFKGYDDVVLIKLERPEGMRLGYAELPAVSQPPKSRSSILLFHFPKGQAGFYGTGKIKRVRGIDARCRHDVGTDEGSSGGPCFNTKLAFTGIHQGRWTPDRRLVPANLFLEKIREEVKKDIAPVTLWSLDNTPTGQLVIGRDLFFETIAAAIDSGSRVRGIRVKRLDPAQGTAGLAYSLEMLKLILGRRPGKDRIVRINFDSTVGDLIEDIRRRAIASDIRIQTTYDDRVSIGSRASETTLEAAANDQARCLTVELNEAAERADQLFWFLFENPVAGLTSAERLAFEAFISAAIRQRRLRLVLTGFETITTPGEEFKNAGRANGEGAPGLVVEYFGVFRRDSVEQLLARACRDFGVKMDNNTVIADRANQILQGLTKTGESYSTADLKTVGERAVPHLEYLRSLAGAGS